MTRRASISAVVVVAGVCIVASCREATSVVIEARTNLPYRAGLFTSFTVGGPGETERAEATTESRDPWGGDGFVGSLVVVPGSSDDAQLSVRVVLGVDRDARTCAPPKYDGCIVARRLLRYTPHERLRLPITLDADCKNVPCDAASTCAKGACVSAEVDLSSCTSDRGCVVPDRVVDPPAPIDGGPDGSTEGGSDAAADQTSQDAISDAPMDAASDGGSPGKVDCRTSTCALQGPTPVCCYDRPSKTGTCVPMVTICPAGPPTFTITCDGPEDCPGTKCCAVNPDDLVCLADCGIYLEVCHSTGTCKTGACTGTFIDYYRFCQ